MKCTGNCDFMHAGNDLLVKVQQTFSRSKSQKCVERGKQMVSLSSNR